MQLLRLQLILGRLFLEQLQQELIAVISKYVKIDPNDIKVHLERQDTLEVLDIKIEMPQPSTDKV